MLKLKESHFHEGHCQITYTCKNDNNEKIVYCIQEHFHNVCRFMRCSQDGEPSHEVTFKEPVEIERPNNDTNLRKVVNEFIDKHDMLIGVN